MTKDEALKLALEALETSARNWPSDSIIEAITAIKEVLAQPEQERCVGCEACIDTACGRDECPKGWPKAAQPEQEPATKEQIREAMIFNLPLYTAPPQPEQEPVAYIKAAELEELKHCNGMSLWAENAAIHTDDSISKQLLPSGHVPVYTTPPQRTWVGLTDEDCKGMSAGDKVVAMWADRTLKEKNT